MNILVSFIQIFNEIVRIIQPIILPLRNLIIQQKMQMQSTIYTKIVIFSIKFTIYVNNAILYE